MRIGDNRNRKNNFVISIFKFDCIRWVWKCIVYVRKLGCGNKFYCHWFVNTKAQIMQWNSKLNDSLLLSYSPHLACSNIQASDHSSTWSFGIPFGSFFASISPHEYGNRNRKCSNQFDDIQEPMRNIAAWNRNVFYMEMNEKCMLRFNFLIADISFTVCNWIELEVQWEPITIESFPFHVAHTMVIMTCTIIAAYLCLH